MLGYGIYLLRIASPRVRDSRITDVHVQRYVVPVTFPGFIKILMDGWW